MQSSTRKIYKIHCRLHNSLVDGGWVLMVKELKTALVVIAAFAFFSFAIAFGISGDNLSGHATSTAFRGNAPDAVQGLTPWCQHYDQDGDGYERVMCRGREAKGVLTDCMDCVGSECAKVNPNGGVCISGTTMMTCADGEVHVRECPGGCVPSGTGASDYCNPAQPVRPGPSPSRQLGSNNLQYGTVV